MGAERPWPAFLSLCWRRISSRTAAFGFQSRCSRTSRAIGFRPWVEAWRMRILLASSELHPYSKTGGLADMCGALAKYLAAAGEEVIAVTPLYRGIRERVSG